MYRSNFYLFYAMDVCINRCGGQGYPPFHKKNVKTRRHIAINYNLQLIRKKVDIQYFQSEIGAPDYNLPINYNLQYFQSGFTYNLKRI